MSNRTVNPCCHFSRLGLLMLLTAPLMLAGCWNPAATTPADSQTVLICQPSGESTPAETAGPTPAVVLPTPAETDPGATTRPASQTTGTVRPTVATAPPERMGAWLTVEDLRQYKDAMNRQALSQGNVAIFMQPDPTTKQTFLAAAANELSAVQFNNYFYWFLDLGVDPAQQPQLLLCIDRLFSDATRDAAMAGEKFSDPRVEELLAFSLQQILKDEYSPDILDFILGCYRRNFANHLTYDHPSAQTWRQVIKRIEVSYEADVYNTISFKVLSH